MSAFVPQAGGLCTKSLDKTHSATLPKALAFPSNHEHLPHAAHKHFTRAPHLQANPALQAAVTYGGRSPCATGSEVNVVWIRDDLRIHDHPALHRASTDRGAIAPVIFFRGNEDSFWAESVAVLRGSLRARGAELYIRSATDVAPALDSFCAEVNATRLYYHMGADDFGRREECAVNKVLEKRGVKSCALWAGSLVSPAQLPFRVQDMPDDCDAFTACVEHLPVEALSAFPDRVTGLSADVEPGALPIVKRPQRAGAAVCVPRGGEVIALELLRDYIAGKSLVSLNGSGTVGVIDTKFGRLAPFIAKGCISVRYLYQKVLKDAPRNSVRRYCAEFELRLRDFFLFLTLKHGVHPV